MADQSIEKRFWAKIDRRGPDECWPWLGWKNTKGYGFLDSSGGRKVRAHGFSFKLAGGVVPPGHNLDHTCFNRGCVNPGHLEAVTPLENIRRGRARARFLAIAADRPATHNAKLTADQVRAIRADPRGIIRLSRALGFSKWLLKDVREWKTYAHIS